MTATGSGASSVPVVLSRRITGTARTRVGISSYQSGADESAMRELANAWVTSSRHCGLICCPTKSSSPEGTHKTMSANARSASNCRSPTSMCSQSTSA